MKVISVRPSGLLRDSVYWFAYYDGFAADDRGFRMMSEGTVDILIPLEGRTVVVANASNDGVTAADEPLLIGPQKSFSLYDTSTCSRAFGIVFAPGGAARFLGPQIGELTNRILPARDVLGPGLRLLHDRLIEEVDPARMFSLADAFLRQRYERELRNAAEIDHAIGEIRNGRTIGVSLVDFAEQTIGFSHKHFVELFTRQVGLTPMRYRQITHFNDMLERCRLSPDMTLRKLAVLFGYTDPSHLVKDFHRFTGMTPGDYRSTVWTHRQVLTETAD
ncbi:MAG: AraC family transcriptional regulator [Spirochaetaceae bacterium]|nr:MAG: AraC family transcriptional regulator [Spirochaetaceae bacterium]